ncbi:MAG: phospholipase [Helicobacteraceae bacterium]|nr:phospholipase [Helicobacteraceae bacterium]
MHFIVLLFVIVSFSFSASFYDAKVAYDNKEYKKAFKIFQELEEESADRDVAYYIATMYENGYGIKEDHKKAAYWYRTSAIGYHEESISDKQTQLNKVREKFTKPISANDMNTLNAINKGNFGFKAYDVNYLLPASYNFTNNYDVGRSGIEPSNMELEFQISLRMDLGYDLLGWGELYSVAYTQHTFWQAYAASAYFRASNYNPEFFMTIPMVNKNDIGLNYVKVAMEHESNGEGGYSERSWNFLSSEFMFQKESLFVGLKLWARLPSGEEYPIGRDYNPDLLDYLGHGELKLNFVNGKSVVRTMFRMNPATGFGAAELSYSYPIIGVDEMYWFVKAFQGYGESLNTYNKEVTKASFGLSFSR